MTPQTLILPLVVPYNYHSHGRKEILPFDFELFIGESQAKSRKSLVDSPYAPYTVSTILSSWPCVGVVRWRISTETNTGQETST
jgi:hypothetical protein